MDTIKKEFEAKELEFEIPKTDLEKLKKKVDEILGTSLKNQNENQNQKNNQKPIISDKRFFIPPFGKTTVRFLPNPYSEDWFKHILYHNLNFLPDTRGFLIENSNNTSKMVLCPRFSKNQPVKKCPICSLVKYLYSNFQNDENAIKLASLLKAKEKFYYNILVKKIEFDTSLKDEDAKNLNKRLLDYYSSLDFNIHKTPLVLSSGIKLFQKLVELQFSPEFGDFTDFSNGYDIVLVKKMVPVSKDKSLPNFDSTYPSPQRTPLFENKLQIREIYNKTYDLNSVVLEKFPQIIDYTNKENLQTQKIENSNFIIESLIKYFDNLSLKEFSVYLKNFLNSTSSSNSIPVTSSIPSAPNISETITSDYNAEMKISYNPLQTSSPTISSETQLPSNTNILENKGETIINKFDNENLELESPNWDTDNNDNSETTLNNDDDLESFFTKKTLRDFLKEV